MLDADPITIYCNNCNDFKIGIYIKKLGKTKNPIKMALKLAKRSPLGIFMDRSQRLTSSYVRVCESCSSEDIIIDPEKVNFKKLT